MSSLDPYSDKGHLATLSLNDLLETIAAVEDVTRRFNAQMQALPDHDNDPAANLEADKIFEAFMSAHEFLYKARNELLIRCVPRPAGPQ